MDVLRINQLCKNYGSIKALDGLNLTVEKGQIMGILGPNGSGKTTTLGLVLGILKPNSGSFEWFENQYEGDHRKHIGSILETPNFFPYLNADKNLDIIRQIKNAPPSNFDEELSLVRLKGRRKSNFRTYSLGMKQRLAIAATLIGNPEVVIFDEPTNGLDPEGIAEVRSILQNIASQGKTVIMASHILDEVEKICSHVTIIKKGKLLATGPVGSILSSDTTIEIASPDLDKLRAFLEQIIGINSITKNGNILECSADEKVEVEKITQYALDRGIPITHFVARKKKLEEEFLEITNRN